MEPTWVDLIGDLISPSVSSIEVAVKIKRGNFSQELEKSTLKLVTGVKNLKFPR